MSEAYLVSTLPAVLPRPATVVTVGQRVREWGLMLMPPALSTPRVLVEQQ